MYQKLLKETGLIFFFSKDKQKISSSKTDAAVAHLYVSKLYRQIILSSVINIPWGHAIHMALL
jgi:hypothetical protein